MTVEPSSNWHLPEVPAGRVKPKLAVRDTDGDALAKSSVGDAGGRVSRRELDNAPALTLPAASVAVTCGTEAPSGRPARLNAPFAGHVMGPAITTPPRVSVQ